MCSEPSVVTVSCSSSWRESAAQPISAANECPGSRIAADLADHGSGSSARSTDNGSEFSFGRVITARRARHTIIRPRQPIIEERLRPSLTRIFVLRFGGAQPRSRGVRALLNADERGHTGRPTAARKNRKPVLLR
jgi:hypothetical protein